MILSTTSKEPTNELRKVARALSVMIPNSDYQPRGQRTIDRMVEMARKKGYIRLIIVDKNNKVKGIKISGTKWTWHPKTLNMNEIKISTERPDYLKCEDKELADFFGIVSEDSEYELIHNNKIMVKKKTAFS